MFILHSCEILDRNYVKGLGIPYVCSPICLLQHNCSLETEYNENKFSSGRLRKKIGFRNKLEPARGCEDIKLRKHPSMHPMGEAMKAASRNAANVFIQSPFPWVHVIQTVFSSAHRCPNRIKHKNKQKHLESTHIHPSDFYSHTKENADASSNDTGKGAVKNLKHHAYRVSLS